jgi:hypothetical protein
VKREPLDLELEQLEKELAETLSRYQVKPASAEDTQRLLAELERELDRYPSPLLPRPSLWRLCRSQLHIYKWPLWMISIAVFAMLTFMSDPSRSSIKYANQPFVLFVPLFILVGALFHFQAWNREMRLVEMITPYPPALLIYSRLLIVLGNNLCLGLISSLYWTLRAEGIPLSSFLLSWIAPAFFLLGVLAYVMFWKGIKTGFVIAFMLWAAWAAHPALIGDLALRETLLLAEHFFLLMGGIGFMWLSYKKGLALYRLDHLLLK